MTDPLNALVPAAQAAQSYAAAQLAAKDQLLAAAAAQHAADQERIAELEAEIPVTATLFGVNASNAAQHNARAAKFAPVQAWRLYRQPGEQPGPITEYERGPGELFVASHKITPAEAATGRYDDDLAALAASLVDGDELCPWHEPEDDIEKKSGGFSLAEYHALCDWTVRVVKGANPAVKVGPIIMGSFTINGGHGRKWRDYLFDGADFLGCDEYFSGVVNGKPFGGSIAQIPGKLDVIAQAAASVGLPWELDECSVGTREGKAGSKVRNDGVTSLAKEARDRGATRVLWFDDGQWVADATAVTAWRAGQAG